MKKKMSLTHSLHISLLIIAFLLCCTQVGLEAVLVAISERAQQVPNPPKQYVSSRQE